MGSKLARLSHPGQGSAEAIPSQLPTATISETPAEPCSLLPGEVTGRLCHTPASSLAVCYPASLRTPRWHGYGPDCRAEGGEDVFRHPSRACFISSPGRACRHGADGVAEVSYHGSGCGGDRFGVRVMSSRSDRGVIMPSHNPTPPPLTLGFSLPFLSVHLARGAECKPPSFSVVEPRLLLWRGHCLVPSDGTESLPGSGRFPCPGANQGSVDTSAHVVSVWLGRCTRSLRQGHGTDAYSSGRAGKTAG